MFREKKFWFLGKTYPPPYKKLNGLPLEIKKNNDAY